MQQKQPVPWTLVQFYMDFSERAPVVDWLRGLKKADAGAFAKCVAVLRRLAQEGRALRRPLTEIQREGVRELRVSKEESHYRFLYFFHEKEAVVLHAVSGASVSNADLAEALERKFNNEAYRPGHTYCGRVNDKSFSTDAIEILYSMIGTDSELRCKIEEEIIHSRLASMIYRRRSLSRLTERELAGSMKITQAAFARLERADHEGYPLSLLVRIAAVLGKRLEVGFVRNTSKRLAP